MTNKHTKNPTMLLNLKRKKEKRERVQKVNCDLIDLIF